MSLISGVNLHSFHENSNNVFEDSKSIAGANDVENIVKNEAYEAIKSSTENIYETLQ